MADLQDAGVFQCFITARLTDMEVMVVVMVRMEGIDPDRYLCSVIYVICVKPSSEWIRGWM